jgi:aconitate hydratase
MADTFGTATELVVRGKPFRVHSLSRLAAQLPAVARLPFSLKILLENLLRHEDGRVVKAADVRALAGWRPRDEPDQEISFLPARVLLQDFTGVPAVADLAAMRDAMARLGGDPGRINPLQPADLVIDHSVQVDSFGSVAAPRLNAALELQRNRERYVFLRWGQHAFEDFRVVPPDTGICHQVNLEYLARVVFTDAAGTAYPDSLVGTDSHTTMINGLGVLGWGVGGIEAEAAMLGQPVVMLIPQVVGFKLHGRLPEGATATDLVLTVTQMLRKKGVVNKFVEFFGQGVGALALADRATIANMAPEYGATMGFFPVDDETLSYLRFTQRPGELVDLVDAYTREQGLFRTDATPDPVFSDVLELDLASVRPSIAGPKRPQDRIALTDAPGVVKKAIAEMTEQRKQQKGHPIALGEKLDIEQNGVTMHVGHGDVVIAAITSCTNTSNPAVMVGAGLLARKAVQRGLTAKPWVKTSLAPGSQVVTRYLDAAGLTPYLEGLGFHTVGYGCTTCIGNSGPLPPAVSDAVDRGDLVVASVLSGNRNFEGRVNLQVRMNFLASPPLVVAYAIAGRSDIDFAREPLGIDHDGEPVFLRDLWPDSKEVDAAMRAAVAPEHFQRVYAGVTTGDEHWRALEVPEGRFFAWDPASTYVRRPPFFDELTREPPPPRPITGARVLALLGDSITTDHISPAGNIAKNSPAARYLEKHGVTSADFNSYGARRGNHEVMVRGTFANTRLRNKLVPGVEGGVTLHVPTGDTASIFDASMRYQQEGTPLLVIAGAEYGTGSSRDWAAKGTLLLGVRAVIAKSFERIHRSNLVGMGVLPLQFLPGEDADTLGLTGRELYDVLGVDGLTPGKRLVLRVHRDGGAPRDVGVVARVDTPNEVDYLRHGGILPFVLRQLLTPAG